jgi:hypothetical protein
MTRGHRKFQNVVTKLTQEERPMTEEKDITYFEQKLLEFQDEEDPVCSMLSWVTEQLMEIEVSHRTGVVKGKHSGDRKTSRSGYRSRRWDTRVGTVFLSVPKVRDGGYIPFFLTERKRSEQALVEVVREAWGERGEHPEDRPSGEDAGDRKHQRIPGERNLQGAGRDGWPIPHPAAPGGISGAVGGRPV